MVSLRALGLNKWRLAAPVLKGSPERTEPQSDPQLVVLGHMPLTYVAATFLSKSRASTSFPVSGLQLQHPRAPRREVYTYAEPEGPLAQPGPDHPTAHLSPVFVVVVSLNLFAKVPAGHKPL